MYMPTRIRWSLKGQKLVLLSLLASNWTSSTKNCWDFRYTVWVTVWHTCCLDVKFYALMYNIVCTVCIHDKSYSSHSRLMLLIVLCTLQYSTCTIVHIVHVHDTIHEHVHVCLHCVAQCIMFFISPWSASTIEFRVPVIGYIHVHLK